MINCIDAFKNLNISYQQNKLMVSPCCNSPTEPADIVDFENNEYLNRVRDSWANGVFPSACSVCKLNEEQNLVSRRIGSNRWYEDNGYVNNEIEMIRLDYWTGNTCNLACVICGPRNSSTWKQELNYPVELKKAIVNTFWKNLDLSKLRFVHFNGGEPLLSKEHVKFLHALPNKNLIHLNYNTNGTILPNSSLLKLWEQFKLVQLDFSIDDIEERFEYQRYPAKWDHLCKNLEWFIDNAPGNCMFAVNTTVSVLNQNNLTNLNNWLKKHFYTNRFTDPVEHRQQLAHGRFSLRTSILNRGNIIKSLNELDARRGTNWKSTFPELVDVGTD